MWLRKVATRGPCAPSVHLGKHKHLRLTQTPSCISAEGQQVPRRHDKLAGRFLASLEKRIPLLRFISRSIPFYFPLFYDTWAQYLFAPSRLETSGRQGSLHSSGHRAHAGMHSEVAHAAEISHTLTRLTLSGPGDGGMEGGKEEGGQGGVASTKRRQKHTAEG